MKAKKPKKTERSRGFEIALGIVSLIVAAPFVSLLAFATVGAIKKTPTVGGFIASLFLAIACYVLLRAAYSSLLRPNAQSIFNPYIAFALCTILSIGFTMAGFAYVFSAWNGKLNTAVPHPSHAGGFSIFTAPFIFGGAAVHFWKQARLTSEKVRLRPRA